MGGVEAPGRVALVTGGSGGIGRAIVARLRSDGVRTLVWDLTPRLGDDETIELDLTDPRRSLARRGSRRRVRPDRHPRQCGGLPGAVSPVRRDPSRGVAARSRDQSPRRDGGLPRGRPDHETKRIRPDREHELPRREQGLAGLSVYGAASAGVIAFTKALAQELATTGIRVNAVAPGPIDTSLITDLGTDVVESMVASSPLGRLGTPAEVAELVVWLCSDAASFTTGAVFDVSGGRAAY